MFICCCLFYSTLILIVYMYVIVFCCMSSTAQGVNPMQNSTNRKQIGLCFANEFRFITVIFLDAVLPDDFSSTQIIWLPNIIHLHQPLLSCCGSLFIILVFHEEDYLCGTYRYTNSVQFGSFWEYKLESCLEKRNYSFICAGGMFFYYSYYILKYVVLHSAFRGGSSVFTKRPMAHLK